MLLASPFTMLTPVVCCWLCAHVARAAYFPSPLRTPANSWQPPKMQPWEELRAGHRTVTVAWTPGWNPWCAIGRYELQRRRPGGAALQFHDMENLQLREVDIEDTNPNWPSIDDWGPWETVYTGLARAYTLRVDLAYGHAVQVRVRACTVDTVPDAVHCGSQSSDACSGWSQIQTVHTVLSAALDKINFFIRGSGKNAPEYTEIEVNQQTVYKRRDETGLVLAVFSRLDFSLQWLRTYDTHRSRDESLLMSRHLRQFNQSHVVFVASTIAWEWHATESLVRALEFCGAYHFGQWAHIFAEQPHYSSPTSDLQEDASQQEFGHPYALVGIPGIGVGLGYESLMYNTGLYLAENVKVPQAIIRGVAYYDYIARVYRFHDVTAAKAEFFLKNNPPTWETMHNPTPARKSTASSSDLMPVSYRPYIGTLREHVVRLIEANATVPPYNFAFILVTASNVRKVDPRLRSYWVTELERVWSGQSARYWMHNGSQILAGIPLEERRCQAFVYHGYTEASPDTCGWPTFEACCPDIDETSSNLMMRCGVGIAPTLCKNITILQIMNASDRDTSRWPFPFTVINLTEYPFPASSWNQDRPGVNVGLMDPIMIR